MQALADNPRVHADEIAVDADEYGDVVVRGTVGSLLQRAEAVRTVRHLPEVRDVDDQLRVRVMGIEGHADADTSMSEARRTSSVMSASSTAASVRTSVRGAPSSSATAPTRT
jgi:hypothetical protein